MIFISLKCTDGPVMLTCVYPFTFGSFAEVDKFLIDQFHEYPNIDRMSFYVELSLVGGDVYKEKIDVDRDIIDDEHFFLNLLIEYVELTLSAWYTPESHKPYFEQASIYLKSHLSNEPVF